VIEHVHKHILDELNTNARTDITFALVSIFLNLITLAINSFISMMGDLTGYIVFACFAVLIIIVNIIAIVGLTKGKQTRYKLLNGLLKLYDDQEVAGYYDTSILEAYNLRYTLFTIAVVTTGVIALIVPSVVLALS